MPSSQMRHYWLGGKRADEQDRFFREALEARGWVAGNAENWQAGWFTGTPALEQFRKLSPTCKLNHLPGNNALTLKNRLYQSLAALRERMSERFGPVSPQLERLDFFPHTYLMPDDYHALQEAALTNPEQCWILKPANASKGKGIRLLGDAADAPRQSNWLVQEYLDNPHTIRGHKYVLRLYVLLASLDPLRLYVYRQGFAKLASALYDRDDKGNPYSHLTNPDINARNMDAEVPVEFIDLDRYRAWLREQGHDYQVLFERIHDQLTLTVIAALDNFRQRCADEGVDSRGGYELLGIDCLIDADLKPWILECNLSPSLGVCAGPDSGGPVEEAVKRRLVEDLVALVGIDDQVTASVSDDSPQALLDDAQRELSRAGDFLRLYPGAEPADHLAFFTLPSRQDWQLAEALTETPLSEPSLLRGDVCELIDNDCLALYDTQHAGLLSLNDSAALIWLLASEGETPSDIVAHLHQASQNGHPPPDRDALERHVWQCLEDWCRQGLLRQAPTRESAHRKDDNPTSVRSSTLAPAVLSIAGRTWALHTDSLPARERLAGILTPWEPGHDPASPRLELIQETGGYRLMVDAALVASNLSLAAIGPRLIDELGRRALAEGQLMIDAALLVHRDAPESAILVPMTGDDWQALRAMAEPLGYYLMRGIAWHRQAPSPASVLALPLTLPGGRLITLWASPRIGLRIAGVAAWGDDSAQPTPLALLAALLPASRHADTSPPNGQDVSSLLEWLTELPRFSLPGDHPELVREHLENGMRHALPTGK
ncbi:tubulin polyglutamylase TTLL5 [Modicisalibacter xianhensis]|uniref:Tubulin polyglutamylase TTLL5 n=1 Tax=Modicisalibacter xianhensis TaxID=442341 RepID=A0A4R8FPF7_9GAMM|nr:amylase [Halomonas xianhensis]TDX28336.1 tubulin polyglutamylase TTLL5 [Halomonas xianhensis]